MRRRIACRRTSSSAPRNRTAPSSLRRSDPRPPCSWPRPTPASDSASAVSASDVQVRALHVRRRRIVAPVQPHQHARVIPQPQQLRAQRRRRNLQVLGRPAFHAVSPRSRPSSAPSGRSSTTPSAPGFPARRPCVKNSSVSSFPSSRIVFRCMSWTSANCSSSRFVSAAQQHVLRPPRAANQQRLAVDRGTAARPSPSVPT